MEDINKFLASLKAKGDNKNSSSYSSSSSAAPLPTVAPSTTCGTTTATGQFDLNLFLRRELERVAALPLSKSNDDDDESSDEEFSRYHSCEINFNYHCYYFLIF